MSTDAHPLLPVQRVGLDGFGPEDVVVDKDGSLITGVEDGRIFRIDPRGGHVDTIIDTGGRPLGIELSADGAVVVCDARCGLLLVDPQLRSVEVLVDEVEGEPLLLCNNAAVAADGTVFFSESSRRFGLDHWRADLFEHSGTGRLLSRSPDGHVNVLLDGLQFANGVALSPDESFVVVAELGSYRLTRLWLTGKEAGTTDTLVDNLPAFPDNLSLGSDGLIWVALPSLRSSILDRLHTMHPLWRRLLWAVPERLHPDPKSPLWIMAVDTDGTIVHDIQNPAAEYHHVTGVREHGGRLYLASLFEHALAVTDVPSPIDGERRTRAIGRPEKGLPRPAAEA